MDMYKRMMAVGVLAVASLVYASGSSADAVDCVGPGDVTSGDDVVCLTPGDAVAGSGGDDTYYIMSVPDVANHPDTRIQITGGDPGTDTVSLQQLDHGYSESFNADGYGGMFGVWLKPAVDPEVVRYTQFDDTIGDPNGAPPGSDSGITFYMQGGNDNVYNITGTIYSGSGNDLVDGITGNTVVHTQGGNDQVIGDQGADVIHMGSGSDYADVAGKGSDTVVGGPGSDSATVSRNDQTTSLKRLHP